VGAVTTGLELCGFTVGVTADRRSQEQVLMFEKLGLDVVRAPVIKTLPVGDGTNLRAMTEALIADPPDYLVANTGLGMRSWFGLAEVWGLDQSLREALAGTRIAARGPKAAGAVGIAGLEVWWRAGTEQLTSVSERLLAEQIAGKRVALQLHGDDRQDLTSALVAAGAEVVELSVYHWMLPDDDAPARRLIDLCCAGAIDAITFTAGPAVRNLVELAGIAGRAGELLDALNGGMVVACIGPVCAAAAVGEGIPHPLVPERWRLGSLVGVVAEALAARRHPYQVGGHELVLQGSVALVDGRVVRLTEREGAVLTRLAEQPGATVTRGVLLREVWKDPGVDPHVLETTIARLRAKLGPAGEAIETAVRRGYRLSAPPWPVVMH
jgi:uroporphyrinogen-III synthase